MSWLSKTPEAALKSIRKVVADIVEDMQNNGEAVPDPIAGKHYSGKFMARVPPEIHRKLAIQAAESGVSLNRIAPAQSLASDTFQCSQ